MAVHNKIAYANLPQLHLDPDNPRLGRENTKRDLSERKILDLMKDRMLEELALSFLESGFGRKQRSPSNAQAARIGKVSETRSNSTFCAR